MPPTITTPQISVLDTGGQYTHLITRKVRELGVYADIVPSETPASELRQRKGLIISGGPHSVYEPGSPTVDPAIFELGAGVLGICYGQQLMAQHLGGRVTQGDKGEYGLAYLTASSSATGVLAGLGSNEQIWMSHRDSVAELPSGFRVAGTTDTCAIAAIEDPQRRLYGVQFHPEVVHTTRGMDILQKFVFEICRCEKDWNPADRIAALEEQIRETAQGRHVLFFVSGGVDSTVAYDLCLRALGPERVRGYYVDTGFMREGETAYVEQLFQSLNAQSFTAVHAADEFLHAVTGLIEPEKKRKQIGEAFVAVQERVLASGDFLSGEWILGQGTIYPDTIESGGTAKADVIKTHHNRVEGIQKLIAAGRIVEPLALFYKDEVREVGEQLGLPHEFLHRHPFPGPGLAIRCLCSGEDLPVAEHEGGTLIPVKSVGVQGDSRTYRSVLVIDAPNHAQATDLINRYTDFNRVVAPLAKAAELATMRVHRSALTPERLAVLRRADAVVRAFCHRTGVEEQVWQFPVILIPLGTDTRRESLVLRPVTSVDGMTAQSVCFPGMEELASDLLHEVPELAAVLLDLTHKPPGTIEWE